MKIGILSDSHSKTDLTQDALDMFQEKGVKYLIHSGDLVKKENLDVLKNSGMIYIAIFGNNDYNLIQYQNDYKIYQEPYYFKIEDIKFKLMHIPNYLSPDSDIIIFGHTHIHEHQYTNKTLFINSGEICAREKDLTECVILEITEKEYIIEYNHRKPTDKNWETKITKYER